LICYDEKKRKQEDEAMIIKSGGMNFSSKNPESSAKELFVKNSDGNTVLILNGGRCHE